MSVTLMNYLRPEILRAPGGLSVEPCRGKGWAAWNALLEHHILYYTPATDPESHGVLEPAGD